MARHAFGMWDIERFIGFMTHLSKRYQAEWAEPTAPVDEPSQDTPVPAPEEPVLESPTGGSDGSTDGVPDGSGETSGDAPVETPTDAVGDPVEDGNTGESPVTPVEDPAQEDTAEGSTDAPAEIPAEDDQPAPAPDAGEADAGETTDGGETPDTDVNPPEEDVAQDDGTQDGGTQGGGEETAETPADPTETPPATGGSDVAEDMPPAETPSDPVDTQDGILVSNAEELYAALAKAQGGETILLEGGDYGSFNLNSKSGFDITFPSEVTITSADPDHMASFSDMLITGAANLIFDGVVFDYTFAEGDRDYTRSFLLEKCQDISLVNSIFSGDLARDVSSAYDGYGYGVGLGVRDSSNIVVEGNEFFDWTRAGVFSSTDNLTVKGNEVHSISSDGFDFIEVNNVLIEDNYLHDFSASKDTSAHMDMIQFWTKGTYSPSTDIVIRGNILDIENGHWAQSIFMRNEAVDTQQAGQEMFYKNVLIEQNTILNGHIHGITVGETEGLTINSNTILSIDQSSSQYSSTPQINLAADSVNVTVVDNAVKAVNGYQTQPDWTVQNNAYIQNTDPDAPGYYSDLFVDSSLSGSVAEYVVAPDSVLATVGAGADRLFLDTAPEEITPQFDVSSSPSAERTLVFDGSHSYGPQGQISEGGARFVWTFSDGGSAEGPLVHHTFATAGHFDAKLEIILPDGTTAATKASVGLAGDDILSFNADDGRFYRSEFGEDIALDVLSASSETEPGPYLQLGGEEAVLSVSRQDIARFFGTDAFDLSMTLQAANPGESWGEVVRLHQSFTVTVLEDGDVRVGLYPDTGERVSLATDGLSVNDGAEHDISIAFDGASDSLQVMVDGTLAASQTVLGGMQGMGSWDLSFGSPFAHNFDGKLIAFDLDAATRDYPVSEASLAPGRENTFGEENDIVEFAALAPSEPEAVVQGDVTENNEVPVLFDERADELVVVEQENALEDFYDFLWSEDMADWSIGSGIEGSSNTGEIVTPFADVVDAMTLQQVDDALLLG
ncbi:hypothetical protein E0K89_022080 [Aquicoccus sp. SCR17]|nr:hypothetical protein [Carideicomes alvinocaridis]